MSTTEEPIFMYLKMLHANGGTTSPETEAFKKQHLSDPPNSVLARGAERLFECQDKILLELESIKSEGKWWK